MAGIVSYGVYVPRYRLKLSDIAQVWKKDGQEISKALKVQEKAVTAVDEDAITMAVEAAYQALQRGKISAEKIESIFVGSESHPYAVNPSSTIVADGLGIGNDYFAADLEFACKAGTAGVQITLGLLESKKIQYGLVIGSDAAQAKPHDILEYTASAGACALILGNKRSEIIAEITTTSSFTSNTPDFWRRDGQRYPSHFGRFTGEPAYFSHIISEAEKLLEQTKTNPTNYDYCVFHMPNGKFPRLVAKKLGFTPEQLAPSLVVDQIGNPYSGSCLIGLSAVLDIAKPYQKIFLVSYGSGAGADGFVLKTTQRIISHKSWTKGSTVKNLIEKKQYVSYVEYLKQTHKL